ncbi:MAG: hypothetical protein QXU32_13160 [Nitrososphaerales archaeon]
MPEFVTLTVMTVSIGAFATLTRFKNQSGLIKQSSNSYAAYHAPSMMVI